MHPSSWIDPEALQFSAPVPMYLQISGLLKQKIREGKIQPGELLPGEMELCEELNVCRTTVRRAFRQLENDGLIIRKKGKGTFVSVPEPRNTLQSMYRFPEEMRAAGHDPAIEVLSFRKARPSSYLSELLEISADTQICKIDRLFYLDGIPLFLEASCIPAVFLPDMDDKNLREALWTTVFSHSALRPIEAVETYDAVMLSEKQAALLQCSPGSAAFQIQRVSREQHGAVFEVSRMIAPAGKNVFSLTFRSSGIISSRVLPDTP